MSAQDILRSGDLAATLAAVQADVRKEPEQAKHRIFLAQLLCVLGEWNKAVMQLRLAAQMDEIAIPMAQMYREAIGCELVRERVFRGETQPLVFGEPQQWTALLLEAMAPMARGDHVRAAQVRDQAFEMAPATSGKIDGTAFEWIADADMRLGPVLEVLVNGKYYWAPFNAMIKVTIYEPTDLRDRVWMPAEIIWAAGGETPALIPTRYPFSAGDADDALRLSKATRWDEIAEGVFTGMGQRILATDVDEIGLMDVRSIALDVEPIEVEAPEGEAAAGEPEIALRAGGASAEGADG